MRMWEQRFLKVPISIAAGAEEPSLILYAFCVLLSVCVCVRASWAFCRALDQLSQTQKVHRSQTHVPRGKFTTLLETSNAQFREPRAMHAILPARGSTLCVRSGGYCCRFAARAANKTLTNQSQPSVSLSSEKKTERRARTFVLAFFQRIAFLMRNSAEKYNRNGLSIGDNPSTTS